MVISASAERDSLFAARKKRIRFTVLIIVAVHLLCVGLCFFVRRENARFLQMLITVISMAAVWYGIGSLCLGILPLSRRIRHLDSLIAGVPHTVVGMARQTDEIGTVSCGITAQTVEVQNDSTHLCYWDTEYGDCPFDGKNVTLTVVGSFVVAWEVQDETV